MGLSVCGPIGLSPSSLPFSVPKEKSACGKSKVSSKLSVGSCKENWTLSECLLQMFHIKNNSAEHDITYYSLQGEKEKILWTCSKLYVLHNKVSSIQHAVVFLALWFGMWGLPDINFKALTAWCTGGIYFWSIIMHAVCLTTRHIASRGVSLSRSSQPSW